MTEMAETHVELNQFPVPRVGPRHSTQDRNSQRLYLSCNISYIFIGAMFTRIQFKRDLGVKRLDKVRNSV